MTRSLAEAREIAMDLSEADQETKTPRWRPEWLEAWTAECERRYQRIVSGEDQALTLDEFLNDDDH